MSIPRSAFILVASLLWGFCVQASPPWLTIETKYFAFHFPELLTTSVQKLASGADAIHETLAKKYAWRPWGRTQVVVTDTQDNANGYSHLVPYNWVVLYASFPRPDEPLGNYDDWLRTVFIHEYTHILHIDQYGGLIRPFRWVLGKLVAPNGLTPSWYREGLATHEETVLTKGGRGRSTIVEMIVRGAVLEDKFPRLDEARGYQWRWPGPMTPYYFGVEFLGYLAEKYGEEKFEELNRRTSGRLTFFAYQMHAKKVYGKSFRKLWKEWHQFLLEKYGAMKEELGRQGLTPWEMWFADDGNVQTPALSPDGKTWAYVSLSPKRAAEVRLFRDGKIQRVLDRVSGASRLSFSPDGRLLTFSAEHLYKHRYVHRDLFLTDLNTRKTRRLTEGARVRDPVFFPDGKGILLVTQKGGTDQFRVYDLESGSLHDFGGEVSPLSQISFPSFSPDGRWIIAVASRKGTEEKNTWDLRLYDSEGRPSRWLTQSEAIEMHPRWMDQETILFTSDATGIPNVHSYHLKTGQETQVTRVVTGVFVPIVDDEGQLYVQYFHGTGFDLRRSSLRTGISKKRGPSTPSVQLGGGNPQIENASKILFSTPVPPIFPDPKPYKSFKKSLLFPRYAIPTILRIDDAFLFDVFTGSHDPIQNHQWRFGGNIRTDNQFLATYFYYTYGGHPVLMGAGFDRYSVDFGNIRFEIPTSNRTVRYFEKRHGGFGMIRYPFEPHDFAFVYFYEDRSSLTGLSADETARLNLGGYAGVRFNYAIHRVGFYPASISWEDGRRLRLTTQWTDQIFGSARKNEQRLFSGDWREYIGVPGTRHVVALRAAGGMTFGDELVQGNFTLGGSLGELPFAKETSAYYFSLRGIPFAFRTGSRAVLFTAEYRLPLTSPQRAFLLDPIFLKNIHLALFSDFGNAWSRAGTPSLKNFFDGAMLTAGLEVRADFVINPGLPLFVRTGYAYMLRNRGLVSGSKDAVLGTDLQNGTFILQTGTAF